MIHDDTERFPNRKNPRMKHYDYSTPNYYFITICTHNKICIFGEPGKLNGFAEYVVQCLQELPLHFPNTVVDKYVIMPNHIHMILILQDGSCNLSTVIGQLKSYITRQIHRTLPNQAVWQPSFHDHVVRNQKSYEAIWQYIENNPLKWEDDCFYSDREPLYQNSKYDT